VTFTQWCSVTASKLNPTSHRTPIFKSAFVFSSARSPASRGRGVGSARVGLLTEFKHSLEVLKCTFIVIFVNWRPLLTVYR
jgi:hypothetical protein